MESVPTPPLSSKVSSCALCIWPLARWQPGPLMHGSSSSGSSVMLIAAPLAVNTLYLHWFMELWTQCPIRCNSRLTCTPPTAVHCHSSSTHSQSSLSAPSLLLLLLLEIRTKGTQTTHTYGLITHSAEGRRRRCVCQLTPHHSTTRMHTHIQTASHSVTCPTEKLNLVKFKLDLRVTFILKVQFLSD